MRILRTSCKSRSESIAKCICGLYHRSSTRGAPTARVILIRRPMKITSVRSFLLSYPFPEPIRLPFYGGERTLLKRDAMFTRVEADNGLVGYAPGPGSESVHRAIGQTIAPFLEGRVLADTDALRVQFVRGPGADAG